MKMSLTVKPKLSRPSMLKNHIKIASTKAKKATKAIRFEIMPPIGPTTFDAPSDMAIKIFVACLLLTNKNSNFFIILLLMNYFTL